MARRNMSRMRRQHSGVNYLGATTPVLSQTPATGVTGYATAVITAVPSFTLSWTQLTGVEGIEAWIQGATGALVNPTGGPGTGGTLPITWATLPALVYLVPVDSSGNAYEEVEMLQIGNGPGIYASPSTPSSVIATLQAANPGLNVYQLNSNQNAPAPAAAVPFYDQPETIFGFTAPLGVLLGAGALAVYGVTKH